jgi:hypothetical protein
MRASSVCGLLRRAVLPQLQQSTLFRGYQPLLKQSVPGLPSRTLHFRCFAAASTPAMEELKKRLKDPDLLKNQLFVGGQWVDAASGETVDVRVAAAHPTSAIGACMQHACTNVCTLLL